MNKQIKRLSLNLVLSVIGLLLVGYGYQQHIGSIKGVVCGAVGYLCITSAARLGYTKR